MSFESTNPIFVRVVAECTAPPPQNTTPAPFLVQVCVTANDNSGSLPPISSTIPFRLSVTPAARGPGMILLRSGDVKLVMEGVSESEGAAYAKLIAQKAKGLPKISLHLVKVVGPAAAEANANLALELHKEFIDAQGSLKEKSSTLRKQLDMVISSRKGHAMKMSNTENSDSSSALISQDSPDKHAAHSPSSKRGTNRVAPAHRRSKVRGAVLHDTAADA